MVDPAGNGAVPRAPVIDGSRVYIALRSGHVAAYDLADGTEIWRKERTASVPLAADAGLLFVAAGEAIEALRGCGRRHRLERAAREGRRAAARAGRLVFRR